MENLKLLLKFNSDLIIDDATTGLLTTNGTNLNAEVLSGGLGYVMKAQQYLSETSVTFDITSSCLVSFWLHPVNDGKTITELIANPIKMPVISIIKDGVIVLYIYESTLDDSQNTLTIELIDGSYTYTTSAYDANMWHHVWINYDSSFISVYIDATLSVSGVAPDSLELSGSGDFYINKNKTEVFAADEACNHGYIDDIAIFNISMDYSYLQRVINNSIDQITDTYYDDILETQYGFLFNDPSTIKVTSMIDDMSFIYVARNDGKIYKGSPLLWETRKVFSNTDESLLLNEYVLNSTSSSSSSDNRSVINNGFLTISNSLIRL